MLETRFDCALDIKLNEFKIGNEAFDECKTTLEEADKSFADLESFANNSEVHIYDYFEEVKRQVDLRRETLKQKIDLYSNEIIHSIEATKIDIIKLAQEVNQLAEYVENSNRELEKFTEVFDTFEIEIEKYKRLKSNLVLLKNKKIEMLEDYRENTLGYKKYSFEFRDMPIEDVFGQIIDKY